MASVVRIIIGLLLIAAGYQGSILLPLAGVILIVFTIAAWRRRRAGQEDAPHP